MPKASGDTWNRFQRMRGSFSIGWSPPMWIPSKDFSVTISLPSTVGSAQQFCSMEMAGESPFDGNPHRGSAIEKLPRIR